MVMKNFIGLLAFTSIALINTAQAEGDIETGRALGIQCSACHGTDGMSTSEQFPSIAGQKESYLIKQLEQYQSGERTNPAMEIIVAPLKAQDIKDLAAFFASNSAVASYSFEKEVLSIPYVDVGGTKFNVEMSLDSLDDLIFSVTHLEER